MMLFYVHILFNLYMCVYQYFNNVSMAWYASIYSTYSINNECADKNVLLKYICDKFYTEVIKMAG